jgi:hypothetical protein
MRWWAAALLAVCLLVTGGCDGDPDEAGPTPETESSTTAGPTDPPTPDEPIEPTLPAEAEGSSPQAAKAFVGYFIELFNFARETGTTETFLDATQHCAGCRAYARLYERQYQAGGSNKTKGWAATNISLQRESARTVALVSIHSYPLIYTKTADSEPEDFAAENYSVRLTLVQNSNGWKIAEFEGT